MAAFLTSKAFKSFGLYVCAIYAIASFLFHYVPSRVTRLVESAVLKAAGFYLYPDLHTAPFLKLWASNNLTSNVAKHRTKGLPKPY